MKFYAVAIGKNPGIYDDWQSCKTQVVGYSGSKFKSFNTRSEASEYLDQIFEKKSEHNVKSKEIPFFNKTRIYTDGSSKDSEGGYAIRIIYPDGEIVEQFEQVPLGPNGEKPTNQRCELFAILMAISSTTGSVVIYTDSLYSIRCVTEWAEVWKKNGWINSKGGPVLNQDLIKAIIELSNDRNIRYEHVRAHKGDPNNERVDRLANKGRINF